MNTLPSTFNATSFDVLLTESHWPSKSTNRLIIFNLIFWAFTLSVYSQSLSDIPSDCRYRDIAEAISTNQLQKALTKSVECEKALSKQQSKPFAEPMLRAQYFATAQILIAQGEFDRARARISKAENLAKSVLIPSDEIEDATRGYLLERSGRVDEAILFYQPITQAYAKARLAIIYLDRNQTTAAADTAGAALKTDPTNSTALIVLGTLLEKTSPSQALVQYKNAIASASADNPSVTPLRYLEMFRARAGIARLEPKP